MMFLFDALDRRDSASIYPVRRSGVCLRVDCQPDCIGDDAKGKYAHTIKVDDPSRTQQGILDSKVPKATIAVANISSLSPTRSRANNMIPKNPTSRKNAESTS